MHFQIVHTTEYEYSAPAVESYSELRVRPRNTLRQVVNYHTTEVHPRVPLEAYNDYYGNCVETLSVPFRHKRLIVTSRSAVETRPILDPLSGLDLSISEAVRCCWAERRELYDFLMPSQHVPITQQIEDLACELMPADKSFAQAVTELNTWMFKSFKYTPGVTDIRTPISKVLESRQGVCQDFAHLMIALIRAVGLPARYVSGYIETDAAAAASLRKRDRLAKRSIASYDEEEPEGDKEDPMLIGATASHAWVEIYAPNGHWVGLDPTNNILEGERHVQIGVGRDYGDVSPLRGVFKGPEQQLLSVNVSVVRSSEEEQDRRRWEESYQPWIEDA
ncbi:MAG: transglutaminase domain-containing protein [Candidatus Methylacidiphilales bacterium]|nr:transglutaminase family protein [Candidatus Methylacidiphilales bacterium]